MEQNEVATKKKASDLVAEKHRQLKTGEGERGENDRNVFIANFLSTYKNNIR